MGFFWEEGQEPGWEKVSNYNKGQNKLLKSDLQQTQNLQKGGYGDAMSLLQQYLNPQSEVYNNLEKPYMQQFEQQTVPGLAERFAGMGAMGGGLSSSGFGQALGAAGGNLQAQLMQMKEGYRRQSINDLLGQYNQMANRGLSARPFENAYNPGTQGQMGVGGQILSGLATGAATAFGGPAGGAAAQGATNMFKGAMNGSGGGGGGYQGNFGQLPNFGGY